MNRAFAVFLSFLASALLSAGTSPSNDWQSIEASGFKINSYDVLTQIDNIRSLEATIDAYHAKFGSFLAACGLVQPGEDRHENLRDHFFGARFRAKVRGFRSSDYQALRPVLAITHPFAKLRLYELQQLGNFMRSQQADTAMETPEKSYILLDPSIQSFKADETAGARSSGGGAVPVPGSGSLVTNGVNTDFTPADISGMASQLRDTGVVAIGAMAHADGSIFRRSYTSGSAASQKSNEAEILASQAKLFGRMMETISNAQSTGMLKKIVIMMEGAEYQPINDETVGAFARQFAPSDQPAIRAKLEAMEPNQASIQKWLQDTIALHPEARVSQAIANYQAATKLDPRKNFGDYFPTTPAAFANLENQGEAGQALAMALDRAGYRRAFFLPAGPLHQFEGTPGTVRKNIQAIFQNEGKSAAATEQDLADSLVSLQKSGKTPFSLVFNMIQDPDLQALEGGEFINQQGQTETRTALQVAALTIINANEIVDALTPGSVPIFAAPTDWEGTDAYHRSMGQADQLLSDYQGLLASNSLSREELASLRRQVEGLKAEIDAAAPAVFSLREQSAAAWAAAEGGPGTLTVGGWGANHSNLASAVATAQMSTGQGLSIEFADAANTNVFSDLKFFKNSDDPIFQLISAIDRNDPFTAAALAASPSERQAAESELVRAGVLDAMDAQALEQESLEAYSDRVEQWFSEHGEPLPADASSLELQDPTPADSENSSAEDGTSGEETGMGGDGEVGFIEDLGLEKTTEPSFVAESSTEPISSLPGPADQRCGSIKRNHVRIAREYFYLQIKYRNDLADELVKYQSQ